MFKNKYLSAVSTNLIFFLINTIFFLVITPVSIKIMGGEFYGMWAILYAIMLFSGIGTLKMSSVMMKFGAELPDETQNSHHFYSNVITSALIIVLISAVIVSMTLILLRDNLADYMKVDTALREQFRYSLLLVAINIFPQFLISVPQGYLLSQLKNNLVRRIDLLSSVSIWVGAVVIASIQRNLGLIAFWCLISNIVIFLIYFILLKKSSGFEFHTNLSVIRRMIRFSSYMFIESIGITLFQQADRIIVGFVLGPLVAGVYSVGTSVGLRMSLITGQITEVMIPYASLTSSVGNNEKLYNTFRTLSRYVSLMLAVMGGLLLIWMDEILSVWISPDYAIRYSGIFRLIILAYGLLSLCRPAHQTLTGLGKVKFTSIIYIFSSVLMLTGLYFFSVHIGFYGAAAANLILVSLLVFNLYAYHHFTDQIKWRELLIDLKWGIILPTIIYFTVGTFLGNSITYKVLVTLILGITIAMVSYKDVLTREIILNRIQLIINR